MHSVIENGLHVGKFSEKIDALDTNNVDMRRVVEKIYPMFKKKHVEKISTFVKDFKKQIIQDCSGNTLFQLASLLLIILYFSSFDANVFKWFFN